MKNYNYAFDAKHPMVIATRVHDTYQSSKPVDLVRVKFFVHEALKVHRGNALVVVAVGGSLSNVQAVEKAVEETAAQYNSRNRAYVMRVEPWGRFTPALNALLRLAADIQASYLLLQSLEIDVAYETIDTLCTSMQPEDLVVGAALIYHDFKPGWRILNGVTSPWNTLAIWSVPKLAPTGFLAVAEGCVYGVEAGVEEATAIGVLQKLMGKKENVAKLARINGVRWGYDWEDGKRQEWHNHKMASKLKRTEKQLDTLGLKDTIFVLHQDMREDTSSTGSN
eukprot:6504_1